MRNLFYSISNCIHFLLFLILLIFSVALVINNNRILRRSYFVIAEELSGRFDSIINIFQSYKDLETTITELIKKISELETETYRYKNILELAKDSIQTANIATDSLHDVIYQFIPAKVVNNSTLREENYIILNKGLQSGIKPDMGVVSCNGVVGVVTNTSLHFSRVISLLNPLSKLSCKIKNNNHFGLLVWDGKDIRYSYLTELLPYYISYHIGDTIVTSGYSAIFPEGFPVGVVADSLKKNNNTYSTLKVKLLVGFDSLSEVLVIKNAYQKEQNSILKYNNQ